jgi:hypothetical protein
MTYRFYQDRAKQHIAELEREAHDARPAQRPEMQFNSKLANLTGQALRLVTRLRGSHWHGFRASADLSLVSSQCTFPSIADRSNPGTMNVDRKMNFRVDEIALTQPDTAMHADCVIAS